MLICSILDISSTGITDKLLEKCGVLEMMVLYCIEIPMVCAMKMFSFFFDNISTIRRKRTRS
jgi:hypothetical protein